MKSMAVSRNKPILNQTSQSDLPLQDPKIHFYKNPKMKKMVIPDMLSMVMFMSKSAQIFVFRE